ncbi:MAG TPA: hypothetical protein VFQ38_06315 [Longimicrobiales bacterium]|nr:hypothetical protein [Longimicrobiales bacterium]
MSRTSISAALLLLLPLATLPAGCSDKSDDRSALRNDELGRDLDLALQRDSAAPTFQDTAVASPPTAAAEPEPGPEAGPAPTPPPPVRREPPPVRHEPRPPARREPPVARAPEPAPEPSRPEPGPALAAVPIGTTLSVTLNETLSTRTNQPGDAFSGTLKGPILAADGSVLVPAGATVHGRVTEVAKSDHVGETAVIKLAFESLSFGGKTYPMTATVIEANPQRVTRATTGQQVGKAAAGAAAGAILGKILGHNTKGAIKGAVVGAAAGTAIAMGTADVDAVLAAGEPVVIRTDSPIQVEVARR